MEGLTLRRALLTALGSVLVVRVVFFVLLNVVQVSGLTTIQLLYLTVCAGALFVIKAVVKVGVGRTLALWLCYIAGEVAGSLLAGPLLSPLFR